MNDTVEQPKQHKSYMALSEKQEVTWKWKLYILKCGINGRSTQYNEMKIDAKLALKDYKTRTMKTVWADTVA